MTARSDDTFVDASTAIRIPASNSNGKIRITYSDREGWATMANNDSDVEMGTAAITRFKQRKKNAMVVRFSISVKGLW